ncbi:hypothetical protein [Oligoflexus tunisiensis]|uniref:hypothetical protein n=1 Tax=Oligoflexus tunisiensis TaxID=708132 RepID=UPI00114D07A1|nr:hypothetical protein [Oligoflexus tunisiensis]
MRSKKKVSILFHSLIFSVNIWSCSSKNVKGYTEDNVAKTGNVSENDFNVPELISKMTWKLEFIMKPENIFTGFSGNYPFRVMIDPYLSSQLPESVELTKEQIKDLYGSAEYNAAVDAENKKLTVVTDDAFVSSSGRELNDGNKKWTKYILTTLKTGMTAVKIKYGTIEMTVPMLIVPYTVAQRNTGKARYNTAVEGATPSPACTTCHRSEQAHNHSPSIIASYTDAGLLSFIETGVNSDDKKTSVIPHKMTFANADDKSGIIAYLRSLDPESYNGE